MASPVCSMRTEGGAEHNEAAKQEGMIARDRSGRRAESGGGAEDIDGGVTLPMPVRGARKPNAHRVAPGAVEGRVAVGRRL